MDGQSDKKKILIVEDDSQMRIMLADTFKHEGFVVSTASDGAQGLSVALQEHPDLIILDLLLPHVDGMSMLKKLRAEGTWGAELPVIILTNMLPHSEDINEAIASTNPAYFLTKTNFKPGEIVERVRERLGRS